MVDLSKCKEGDILISKFGKVLVFKRHLSEEDYFDCEVLYIFPFLGYGTRNYDGSVFKKNKREDDEDIIKVYRERFLSLEEIEQKDIKKDIIKFRGERVKTEHYDSPGTFVGISDDGHDYVYWVAHDDGEVIGHSPLEGIKIIK